MCPRKIFFISSRIILVYGIMFLQALGACHVLDFSENLKISILSGIFFVKFCSFCKILCPCNNDYEPYDVHPSVCPSVCLKHYSGSLVKKPHPSVSFRLSVTLYTGSLVYNAIFRITYQKSPSVCLYIRPSVTLYSGSLNKNDLWIIFKILPYQYPTTLLVLYCF